LEHLYIEKYSLYFTASEINPVALIFITLLSLGFPYVEDIFSSRQYVSTAYTCLHLYHPFLYKVNTNTNVDHVDACRCFEKILLEWNGSFVDYLGISGGRIKSLFWSIGGGGGCRID
jgi:hypothetical protein